MGESFPELYLRGGIMERGNFLAAAGFAAEGRQAIYSTFAAFQEPENHPKSFRNHQEMLENEWKMIEKTSRKQAFSIVFSSFFEDLRSERGVSSRFGGGHEAFDVIGLAV